MAKTNARCRDAWKNMMAGSPSPLLVHPLQVLFQEHAKHMVTIKDLQSKVQVLQDFRSKVLQTFPQLENGHPTSNRMIPSNVYPANNGGPSLSPRKSPLSGKGGRMLPSVQKVSPSSNGKRVQMKSQTGLRDQDQEAGSGGGTNIMRGRFNDRTNWGKKFVVVAQGKNWLRLRPHSEKSDSELEESDDDRNSTSDSLHSMAEQRDSRKTKRGPNQKGDGVIGPRQDSGFSTDGKERLTQDRSSDVQWAKVDSVGEDELMNVLEMIGQKSKTLKNQIEKSETGSRYVATLSDIGLKPDDVLTEMERLRSEKEQFLERFVYLEVEKEMYKEEMVRLRDIIIEYEAARRIPEERMEMDYAERTKFQDLLGRNSRQDFVKKELTSNPGTSGTRASVSNRTSTSSTSGYQRDGVTQIPRKISSSLPDRLNQPKIKIRMEKSKISCILQESRPLELQRELLVATLRNELLKSQLEQSISEYNEKIACWQQIEFKLHADMDMCQRTCTELQCKLETSEAELKTERAKRYVLERALEAAYKDLTGSSARGEKSDGVSSAEAVRQLSVETFPVHQITTNNQNDKVDKMSPTTWRFKTPTGNGTAPETGMKPISQLPFHLSRLHSTGHLNDASSNHNDTFLKQNYNENGYLEDDDDDDDDNKVANLCLRLQDVKPGNGSSMHDDVRGPRKPLALNLPSRRVSLLEFSGTKLDKSETILKPIPYFNGSLSSKSRSSDIFTPRFNKSNDALHNSDWDWTYDLQDATQNIGHLSERLNLSEAQT